MTERITVVNVVNVTVAHPYEYINHPASIIDHQMRASVKPPGYCGETYDWRKSSPYGHPAHPENTRHIKPVIEIEPLGAFALNPHSQYRTDAHFCSYALTRDGQILPRFPRISKSALSWLRSEGFEVVMTLFLADVDNPGKALNDARLLAALKERWIGRPAFMRTCGLYTTRHGYRLVQPLASPYLPVEEGEHRLAHWLDRLKTSGFAIDEHCKDWTRLMRCPNVMRESPQSQEARARARAHNRPAPKPVFTESQRAEKRDYSGISAIVPDANPKPMNAKRAASAAKKYEIGSDTEIVFSDGFPEEWRRFANRIGDGIAKYWTDGAGWRDVFLCLAGTLGRITFDHPESVRKDLRWSHIPALVAAIHRRSGSQYEHLTEDRRLIARHALERLAEGYPVKGRKALSQGFPKISALFDAFLPPYHPVLPVTNE